MNRLSLALVILLMGGGAFAGNAHEASQDQAELRVASADDPAEAPGMSPSLRVALAFWLPVYYGMFVWLLSEGQGGGGARRRVRDRRLALSLVPARATASRPRS